MDQGKRSTDPLDTQVESLREEIRQTRDHVAEIRTALLGDLKDEGWLSRLRTVETESAVMKKDIQAQDKRFRGMVYAFAAQILTLLAWSLHELWLIVTNGPKT